MLPQTLYQPKWRVALIRNIPQQATSFPGDNSGLEPPDPFSNSVVKRTCANDSVRSPHVKVGHRQVFIFRKRLFSRFFFALKKPRHSAASVHNEPRNPLTLLTGYGFLIKK